MYTEQEGAMPDDGIEKPFEQNEINETFPETTDDRKCAMLHALVATLGIVSYAAQKAGIPRCTHYKWLKTDDSYKASVDLIDNLVLDFAEARLFKKLQANEWKAIMFTLRTKGKKRGYSLHKENKTVEDFIINYIVKSQEEADMIKSTKKEL